MKAIKFFAVCAFAALMTISCNNVPSVEKQPEGITKADVDSASYALGVFYAQAITNNNLGDMNVNEIKRGFIDALKGEKEEVKDQMFVNKRMSDFMLKRNDALATANQKIGEEFLAKNATVEGVEQTAKGVQYTVVRKGNGKFPTNIKDTILVSYEGSTLNGKVFDSSYQRGDTATFTLNRLIEGWQDGLMVCDEGSEVTMWIPASLAYGPRGNYGIAPNETLKFKVEVHEVKPFVEKAEETK